LKKLILLININYNPLILRLISLIFILSILHSAPLKDADIKEFIEARYAGADSIVYSMISDDFRYYHTPYIGLGIFTEYSDGSLLITGIVDDSLQTMLGIGDLIHEINNKVVSAKSSVITGRVGDRQKLILTKKGDSTFTEMVVPLILVQFSQNDSLFLEDLIPYSDIWYDYHIEILDIVLEKEKASVYYHWEGSREKGGPVFHFYAMELIYSNKKTKLIYKIETLWSEKQFRDQFK